MANLPTLALTNVPSQPSPRDRGALTARPHHGSVVPRDSGALTHRPVDNGFSSLGRGTVGLGPDCNVLLKKYDKETQREWLKVRSGMLARAHADKTLAEAVSPRDRYTKYREEMENQKERKEEQLDKVRMRNASAKKQSKEQHKAWREAQQREKSARVKENKESAKRHLQARWQFRTPYGVWHDFTRSDTAVLCRLEETFGEAGAAQNVELPNFGDSLTVDYGQCTISVPGGGSLRVRKRFMVESNHRGDINTALSSEVGRFKELCQQLCEQMKREMSDDMSVRRQHNESERERREMRRTQSPGDGAASELRQRVQAEKKRAAKAAKRHREKTTDYFEQLKQELREERAKQRQQREEREDQHQRQLANKMKVARNVKLEDAELRKTRTAESLCEKRRKITELNSSRQNWLPPEDPDCTLRSTGSSRPTSSYGITLSKGQCYVRNERLLAAAEIAKSRNQHREQRIRDDQHEMEYRLYLGSTVKSAAAARTPTKPMSPPTSPPRRARADADEE